MKYFIIAGEASGDLHASNLIRELLRVDAQAQFQFLGGDKMANILHEEPLIHYRQMAFMGFIEVLKNIKTISANMNVCKQGIADFQPDALILVDYPSFNLRMARFVKENLPNTKVYYYISPKIWAWKEYRIKDIRKYVDEMFTIFPFETEFYKKHNYSVHYVGNPTVDYIRPFNDTKTDFPTFCDENNLIQKPIIALLPGSRKQEVRSCLFKMITSVTKFEKTHQIVIAKAPAIDVSFYQNIIGDKSIALLSDKTVSLLSHSEVAIVNSGTASLETAIVGTPQVVVYHVAGGRFTLWLKDNFLKVKYISLVNLIADRFVVKELVNNHFNKETLQKEINCLLFDKSYRKKMLDNYSEVADKLGTASAPQNTAQMIYSLMC